MSRLARLAGRILAAAPRPPRHKLHAVRFRRLAGSVRELTALSDDATDKLEGEWILDRSYAMALGQRALELGRSIVFDSRVLCGGDAGRLFASLDTVRSGVEGQLARSRATDPEPTDARSPSGDQDEPAYRLVRDVLELVNIGARSGVSVSSSSAGQGGLAGVVAEAHEGALRSFEALRHEAWGREAGRPFRGAGFPGPVRVVDAGGGTAPPGTDGWRSGLEWTGICCSPLRALFEPLTRPSSVEWPEGTATVLAVVSEECATLDVRWPRGSLLFDACLGDHAEDNVVSVALRGEAPHGPSVLEDVVASEGFRVVPLGPGLTAWLAGPGPEETRRVLGRLGGALAALVSEPATPAHRLDGRDAGAGPSRTLDEGGRA